MASSTCPLRFVALDFETANRQASSACAVGLVRVQGQQIVERATYLIRPPSRHFEFSYVHGLRWETVQHAPTFGELWTSIAHFFTNVDFVAAHNASFDQRVLGACCSCYGIEVPGVPFRCTMKLARSTWSLRPTTLRHVADFLGIELNHHEAGSDAEACARIVLHAS
jgi:DNA polymerase-3 subunit epsilon